FRYSQEGKEQDYFTNRALEACRLDRIPIGVLWQTKARPNTRYKVLGIALVEGSLTDHFSLRGLLPDGNISNVLEKPIVFDPISIEDGRRRIQASRQGQFAFRAALIEAYGGRCAMTGCDILEVLEAAHIVPYRGPSTNAVSNGLLLRADIHTLFDLGLI